MPHIRIIGDVHGRLVARARTRERNYRDQFPRSPFEARGNRGRNYKNLIESALYSVQVGDLASDYSLLRDVDPLRHRVVAGNHDNLPELTPHFLGDFGASSFPLKVGEFSFFFIRGARSVDSHRRSRGINWWPEEEQLTDSAAGEALVAYERAAPAIMISHDCPSEIVPLVATTELKLNPSPTNVLLQACFETHRPSMWLFGHHHRNWRQAVKGTEFICLGELAYFDFDERGNPVFHVPR